MFRDVRGWAQQVQEVKDRLLPMTFSLHLLHSPSLVPNPNCPGSFRKPAFHQNLSLSPPMSPQTSLKCGVSFPFHSWKHSLKVFSCQALHRTCNAYILWVKKCRPHLPKLHYPVDPGHLLTLSGKPSPCPVIHPNWVLQSVTCEFSLLGREGFSATRAAQWLSADLD